MAVFVKYILYPATSFRGVQENDKKPEYRLVLGSADDIENPAGGTASVTVIIAADDHAEERPVESTSFAFTLNTPFVDQLCVEENDCPDTGVTKLELLVIPSPQSNVAITWLPSVSG